MKSGIKYFLLSSAFIGGLFLLSCVNTPKKEKTAGQVIYEEVIEQVEERVLSDKWMEERIQKKWYEGHEYLVMFSKDSRRVIGVDCLGFVHNPNCPCKLEK